MTTRPSHVTTGNPFSSAETGAGDKRSWSEVGTSELQWNDMLKDTIGYNSLQYVMIYIIFKLYKDNIYIYDIQFAVRILNSLHDWHRHFIQTLRTTNQNPNRPPSLGTTNQPSRPPTTKSFVHQRLLRSTPGDGTNSTWPTNDPRFFWFGGF